MSESKVYTLYAKIEGHESSRYRIEEALIEKEKRPQPLISGYLIEDIDKVTSKYESLEDFLESYPEEAFGQTFTLYDPVIIVDKNKKDKIETYPIFDLVFKNDAIELQKKDDIKVWLSNFLISNSTQIDEFRGIGDIYANVSNKYPQKSIEEKIEITLLIYFQGDNEKRYREAYFTLKKLDNKKTKAKTI